MILRYACKMATGAGKTTVMGMLTAWSILNKVATVGEPIEIGALSAPSARSPPTALWPLGYSSPRNQSMTARNCSNRFPTASLSNAIGGNLSSFRASWG
jgi:hypothetical protein